MATSANANQAKAAVEEVLDAVRHQVKKQPLKSMALAYVTGLALATKPGRVLALQLFMKRDSLNIF